MEKFGQMKQVLQNSVVTIRIKEGVAYVTMTTEKGREILKPFVYQPLDITYDDHGYEHAAKKEESYEAVRTSFSTVGEFRVDFYDKSGKVLYFEDYSSVSSDCQERLFVRDGEGYYPNGNYFQPFGINMTYPTKYRNSNGTEFGLTEEFSVLGLRQYERWFAACAKNGVNLVRIWCGGEYFSPDTKRMGEFDYAQFTKLDKLFALANRFKLRLKLTMEHFRYLKENEADVSGIFDKYLEFKGKAIGCEEWLKREDCRQAWLAKLEEYQKRYACDPALFAVEFWNEMNCYGYCNMDVINDWNAYMSKRAREMFPNAVLLNSLGSLDSPWALDCYDDFCFENFDWLQVHSYFDQGAYFKEVTINPIETIKNSVRLLKNKSEKCQKPLFLAETGAVNDCHSGEFRYYAEDDGGMIFVDTVYTPFFLGCIAPGNIWHWDGRYVSSKNLYRYFKPLAELMNEMHEPHTAFVPLDFSDERFYCFVLKGEKSYFVFLRNKEFNWQNVLRDNKAAQKWSGEIDFSSIGAKSFEMVKIWAEEHGEISFENGKAKICDLQYGVLGKGKLDRS